MAGKDKKSKCSREKKVAFSKGRSSGFFAGKNVWTAEQLQSKPRVLSEGLAVSKGMGATAARRSTKAQLIAYITDPTNRNRRLQ